MTVSEIAFVIKQNQEMLEFFSKRNTAGDAEKVEELQASIVSLSNAGRFC